MVKVNLKAIPYCLSDEDIAWVEKTIAGMTDEEKVGQLFFENRGQSTDEALIELVQKYHIGGYRYNGIKKEVVQHNIRTLQENSKIPLFVACNTESGGNGSATDGTYLANGIKIGATGNVDYAYEMGRLGNEEAATMGNNMAFAPVCDIHYNWENTEIVSRAFGNDPDRVAAMSKAYMDGVHAVPGYASVAKHWPGNGQDFRDAHISNNINNFTFEEWMATYGKVYKTLIDGGPGRRHGRAHHDAQVHARVLRHQRRGHDARHPVLRADDRPAAQQARLQRLRRYRRDPHGRL